MMIMGEGEAENTESKQARLEQLQARIYAAKMAYLQRTPFEDKVELTYEDLKRVAQDYIRASYEYQKSRFGEVKVKISVAKLLRR